MEFRLIITIITSKAVSYFSRLFNLGAGGTWPGHISLKIHPQVVEKLESKLPRGSILITGTNGKTTTAKLLTSALEASGFSVLRNPSGANLLNGIASSLILDTPTVPSFWGGAKRQLQNQDSGRTSFARMTEKYARSEIGVFEVDEAAFPNVLERIQPETVVILNLFRDQLDRYAELDFIASKWRGALEKLPSSTKIILNADDPLVASLGEDLDKPVFYFGLDIPHLLDKKQQTIADSIHCSKCGTPLSHKGFYYSHIGEWVCPGCRRKRPKLDIWCSSFKESEGFSEANLKLRATRESRLHIEGNITELKTPLAGLFNAYNLLAAALTSKLFEVDFTKLPEIWTNFDPAFGRQEEFMVKGRRVKILLSKNPTGFTENLKLVGGGKCDVGGEEEVLLLVLNDGVADGRDISWIWDADLGNLKSYGGSIFVSGKRKEDLALRIKYNGITNHELKIMGLKEALASALESIPEGGTLYILPTYTAMLEVRKILHGRRIL